MTLPMLATLRTESVRIHLELYHRGNETSEEERLSVMHKSGIYHPAPYQFVYPRARMRTFPVSKNPPSGVFGRPIVIVR